ncbi:MAG: hypothetical protein PHU46_03095, partial [Rhodocyclaceae bacterium]|nr:hypothetical protein [Rhodocyclaceae bacterium]
FSSDSTNAARPLFLAMITPYSSGGIMANITYIVNVLLERSTRDRGQRQLTDPLRPFPLNSPMAGVADERAG